MKKLFTFLLVFCACGISAQPDYKVWVYLKDKGENARLSPADALSPRAMQRRARQCICAGYEDLPVSNAYMKRLHAAGARIVHRSRWINAVSCYVTPDCAEAVEQLPFVDRIEPVTKWMRSPVCAEDAAYPIISPLDTLQNSWNQLNMLGLDALQVHGFNGKGIVMTVLDAGFTNVDILPQYKHLFESGRIIASRNFVDPSRDAYRLSAEGEHGSRVFSIIAGLQPPHFFGSAYGAAFILGVTEDTHSESSVEEDNWLAAMEWADSIGTDVVSTSLGYGANYTVGPGYTYADMNGRTTIITRAASMAAARGILPVNSAGNEGDKPWRYIIAPADGDSVLSVGGVDAMRNLAPFSSRGPTSDGRLKPNVSARAYATTQLGSDGRIIYGYGTSFSCPLISGLAASLWQADTSLTNMQLFRIIEASSDRHHNPDYDYGHGIPDGVLAYEAITGKKLKRPMVVPGMVLVSPNPAERYLNVAFDNAAGLSALLITISDLNGRTVYSTRITSPERYFETSIDLAPELVRSGLHLLEISDSEGHFRTRKKFFISNR